MSFPAILVGLALLAVSIPIVARPILGQKQQKRPEEKQNALEPQISYEQILMSLRDLDFDHQLGVVTEADYSQIRSALLIEAAAAHDRTASDRRGKEQLIEKAVLSRRRNGHNDYGRCSNCGVGLDPADRFCAACGHQTYLFCPECDQPVEQSDHFCAHCGVQLAASLGGEAGI